MNLKKGDKLLCKNTFKLTKVPSFQICHFYKGKYYKIKRSTDSGYIIEYYRYFDNIKDTIIINNEYIQKHFFTEKQLRKNKLKNITKT